MYIEQNRKAWLQEHRRFTDLTLSLCRLPPSHTPVPPSRNKDAAGCGGGDSGSVVSLHIYDISHGAKRRERDTDSDQLKSSDTDSTAGPLSSLPPSMWQEWRLNSPSLFSGSPWKGSGTRVLYATGKSFTLVPGLRLIIPVRPRLGIRQRWSS